MSPPEIGPDPRDGIATAEELMRSRFEAFRDGDAEWLRRSWHSTTRPAELDVESGPTWRRLQIVETVAGGAYESSGVVEFRATYVEDGELGVLHERSRFIREGGRWFYLDGEILGD